MHKEDCQHQCRSYDGQIHPADPSPVEFTEESTNDRPTDATSSNGHGDDTQILGPLLQGCNVSENDLLKDIQAPAADTLDEATGHENAHIVSSREYNRSNDEDGHGHIEWHLPAQDVREADVDGLSHGYSKRKGYIGPERLEGSPVKLFCDVLGTG